MAACPWSTYTPDPFPFCEEQLCHIIGQPANTWSNIGYFLVAYFLVKDKSLSSEKKYFAFVAAFLGFGSTIFHMSGTYWAKQFDLAGMLMFSALIIAISFERKFLTFIVLVVLTVPLIGFGRSGTYIFLFELLVAVLLQIRKPIAPAQRRLAVKALLIFPIALGINILDQRKILCIPSNHIFTAHGLWHLLTAYCMYLGSRFFLYPYSQTRDS